MKLFTLSDVIGKEGIFIDGDWVESKDQDVNGDVRLIQLADIGDGHFINKSHRFLTSKKAVELRCTLLKPGDVLIARMPEPLGRACIFPGINMSCATVVDVCIVRPDEKIANPNWLKYLINSNVFRNQINKYIKGTTRQRISRGNLAKITFALPPLPDQRHIAQLLSQAEQLIAQRQESLRLLDAYLKSTFLEMFGDPVRNERHWNRVELKLHAKVRIGPFGSLLHREDYVRDGIPMVNPSHIQAGKIVIDPDLTISKAKMNELSAYVMLAGDVVLGRRGEIGRCAVVSDKENGYLCGTGSIFIRPTKELNPTFLYNIISSTSMRRVLESSAKGITMKNLNSGIIENLKIPLPPITLQTQFDQIVTQTELLKTQYQQSLAALEQLYGSLSQKAFKGELNIHENES